MTKHNSKNCIILAIMALFLLSCSGRDIAVTVEGMSTIKLPAPEMEGGMPLMEALKKRKSSREFSTRKLPDQVLSNLLWAAFGVNRPGKNLRTAPSAVNWQDTDIYVVLKEGVYLYQYKDHSLRPAARGDFRGMTGVAMQGFVKKAPLNLVYVTDFAKIGASGLVLNDAEKTMFTSSHSGFISQNVYLFCASEGLATVVRGLVDRDGLRKVLSLTDKQKIILAQTVGYPAGNDEQREPVDLSGVRDGSYTGTFKTDIFTYVVKVVVKNKTIQKVEVLSLQKNKYDAAAKETAGRVVKTGSLEVDTVTGATQSSQAIINAVQDAIVKAKTLKQK